MTLIELIGLWGDLDLVAKIVMSLLVIHPVASAIVAITPTPKDDTVLKAVYSVVEKLALVVGRAKEK